MGLAKGSMQLLLDEAAREPFQGTVVMLGRQSIYFTRDLLARCASVRGVTLHDVGDASEALTNPHGDLSAEQFFRALGFTNVHSMDVSSFEGADLVHDINLEVPPELHNRFDVIIDGGTLEHVFHFPQALANIHSMLRPGGRVIHLSPSSNHMDHGFYMFCPTVFWDYYETNQYSICEFKMIKHSQDALRDPWEISRYTPGCLDQVAYGGLDSAMYAIFAVMKKEANSTSNRIPQQGYYRRVAWSQPTTDSTAETSRSLGDRLLDSSKNHDVARQLVLCSLSCYRALRYPAQTYVRCRNFLFTKTPFARLVKWSLPMKTIARY